MTNLANRWAGRLYGTNTGNVFLDLAQDGQQVSGRLRIMDSVFGVSLYEYTGTINQEFVLHCVPEQAVEGVELGTVSVKGHLTPEGSIKGEWESTIGTAGTFEIHPHDIKIASPIDSNPEQIHNKTIYLGSVRFFKDDVIQLVNFIKRFFICPSYCHLQSARM